MDKESKMSIKLHVNGQFVGYIEKLEYERPAQELPPVDGYARFAPGNEVTVSIQLTGPIDLQERWRVLNGNEELRATDEWYSPIAQEWYPLINFPWKNGAMADDGLYRRKALVLV